MKQENENIGSDKIIVQHGKFNTESRKRATYKYYHKMKNSDEFKRKNLLRKNKSKEKLRQLRKKGFVLLSECKEIVFEFDERLTQDQDEFKAGLVFLYGSLNGIQDPIRLAQATKYRASWIFFLCNNLLQNGIWKDGVTYVEYLFNEEAQPIEWVVEFWLYVACAMGDVKRFDADDKQMWGAVYNSIEQ